MQKKFFILFLSVIFCFAITCGRQDDCAYTIEIIDGVKHVHNRAPLWGDTLKVSLEFVQQIGEFDSEDENYLFFQPFDIAKDSVGNIYIADMGNYRIQKFDSSGNYLATFGRKGQGPSEFSAQPYYLDLNSEGEIYVTDNSLTQWYILTPDGKEKKRFRLTEYGNQFRVSRAGNIFKSYRNMPVVLLYDKPIEQVTTHEFLIGVFDMEGNLIKEFGKPEDFKNDEVTRLSNINYIEIDQDYYSYISFYYKNLIEKYSPEGELLIKIEYPIGFDLSYKVDLEERETTTGIKYKAQKTDFPVVSANIGVDHKKRIWIIVVNKKTDKNNIPVYSTEFYIFDNEGILLGKLPVPEIDGWMRIFQDRLYLIESFQNMCVYEYKIVDK